MGQRSIILPLVVHPTPPRITDWRNTFNAAVNAAPIGPNISHLETPRHPWHAHFVSFGLVKVGTKPIEKVVRFQQTQFTT